MIMKTITKECQHKVLPVIINSVEPIKAKRRNLLHKSQSKSVNLKQGKSKSENTEDLAIDTAEDDISTSRKKTKKIKKSHQPSEPIIHEPRPKMVNSEFVPIPWKGRLGYACLNTVLRARKVPIFTSRTCRIASMVKYEAMDLANGYGPGGGLRFVKSLGKLNAVDLLDQMKWNVAHKIYFQRLSSEMFPFSSHEVYGYKLDFVAKELEKVGKFVNKHDIRLTMHPGQFTQLGSNRETVTINAIRDLEFHHELLERLILKPSLNRDAVLILHLGGTYGNKAEAMSRFTNNYLKLPKPIQDRIVLENDDVSYTVMDLLPLCEELNIPLVLDWHHHNILHEAEFREGNLDLMPLIPRIKNTWTRKGIKQKQHYSESRDPNNPSAMKRRAHSERVFNFPPCDPDMDLMIEAKDKEQAVFELLKAYKIDKQFCDLKLINWPSKGGLEGDEGNFYLQSDRWRLTASDRQKASAILTACTDD